MNTFPKIAVLVSPAQHQLSGRARRGVCDAAALELACTLAEPQQLTVLCAGATGEQGLRAYLGLGVPHIESLAVAGEADVVPALLARLRGFDIVVCGSRSDGQSASGLLPYLLAEGLNMHMVGDVLEAALRGHTLSLRQSLPKGLRRRLEVSGPVVLAVHARAPQSRQFAYARAVAGRILHSTGSAQAGATAMPAWQFEALMRRPRPLKAKVAQSGHSRMLGAIGGDSGARGGEVVKQGNSVDKAQVLLAYLREHRLIDI